MKRVVYEEGLAIICTSSIWEADEEQICLLVIISRIMKCALYLD